MRRGTAFTSPFHVGDVRRGMARVPALPDDDPGPDNPVGPLVAEGMFLSTSAFADSSPEGAERRHVTERAFDIRARRRTTPQGVFAAVADLEFTRSRDVLSVGCVRTRSYPSPDWLYQVLVRALDSSDTLRGLRFGVNDLVVRRGDRLEVEGPSDDPGTGPRRISIKSSEAVDVILSACQGGASWQQVTEVLADRWSNLPEAVVESTLRALVRNGFLLTDLPPSDPCDDPLGHVLGRLPDSDPVFKELSRLRVALLDADSSPPGHSSRMDALRSARELTGKLASTRRPVRVDSAVGAPIRIRKDMAEQVARAAGVLWRLAPGGDRLVDWHDRFVDRFGVQRWVPLLDACDPVTGLGCEVGDTARSRSDEATGVLAGLLVGTLASGGIEVCLDDAMIDALDQREPGDRPEPSAELYARVVGTGTGESGDEPFILAISGLAAPAGSTRARFTGLLPALGADVDSGQGMMTAELVFQPLSHVVAALCGRAEGTSWRIPVGTVPRPGDLRVGELAVVSDGHQLCLWSTRYRRPVRPVHHNRLGHHLMPPLARFLCLVGQHGTVPLSTWSWAPFDSAPFLPRVRYQDAILAPARWTLPEELIRAVRDRAAWHSRLRDWRTSACPTPPSTVVVGDADRQLPLNLDRYDDRELLRRYVGRGVGSVTEVPGGAGAAQAVVAGPSGFHDLEVVIPLSADPDSRPVVSQPRPADVRASGDGMFLPGGEWLSLAVNAPVFTQDSVLERLTAAARDAVGLWDQWFWLRYTTAERGPHLRVRFHGEPRALGGQLLPLLHQGCARLMAEGLSGGFTVELYDQEIERYGGHDAIDAAESVFHRDSELVAAILGTCVDDDQRLALTAISAAEITRVVADGDRRALVPYRLERVDRHVQARIRPRCRALDDTTPPHGELWQARATALTVYRDRLPVPRRVDCASSLIHMHANRMLGDNDRERIARALAVDLIARRTA